MRQRLRAMVPIAIALMFSGAVHASTGESTWRPVGQVGGRTSAVAVEGSLAYVATGFRVGAYDITDVENPREVGSTPVLGDFVSSVFVDGTRIWVGAGSSGLHAFDATDPLNLVPLGSWDSPGTAESVTIVRTTAYLADGPLGLEIVDVTDPANPILRSRTLDMEFAFDVVVHGDYAFVAAAGAGLIVVDVRDPSRAREVARLDTPGFARGLSASGTLLAVADEWGGVRLVDIRDPLHPAEIGSVSLPSWAFGVALSGSNLFVADGSQGLQILDASDPAHPVGRGQWPIPWRQTMKVVLDGARAFVVVRTEGVKIVDIQVPSNPTILGEIAPLSNAVAVAVSGDLAFVAAGDQGLRIVDVSEPASARERGGYAVEKWTGCVAADENRAYVNAGSVLYAIDPSDMDVPNLASSFVIPPPLGGGRALVRVGDRLFMPDEYGLQVFDISSPNAITAAGAINFDPNYLFPTDASTGATAVGTTAFVTKATQGVKVVDVADPANLRQIGEWRPDAGEGAVDLSVAGDVLHVLTFPPRLVTLDIGDPARPSQLGRIELLSSSSAERVTVRGNDAFIASGAFGVIIIDVSDPRNPVERARVRLPGYAWGLAFANDRLVVADGEAGLFVLQKTVGSQAVPRMHSTPAGDVRQTGMPLRSRLVPRALAPHAATVVTSSTTPSSRTIIVSSTADIGVGTLREALASARSGDVVRFDAGTFPPDGATTIHVTTELPCLCSGGVTIDGTGARVILDGGGGPAQQGVLIQSDGNTVRGLEVTSFAHEGVSILGKRNVIAGNVIHRNPYAGIGISTGGSDNRIVGNRIGTDASGTVALGIQGVGVFLFGADPGNVVGGPTDDDANVISGNRGAEVFLQQTRAQTIQGNFLGTDPTGTVRVGSFNADGIGTAVTADDVIAENVIVAGAVGVLITDSGSCCNQIVNNRVGIGPNDVAIPGGGDGISLSESFNRVAGNVITTQSGWGVTIGWRGTAETIVTGNRIGTDSAGSRSIPNGASGWGGGITLHSAVRTFIGGSTAQDANVISGNTGWGILLQAPVVDSTFIVGNRIGIGSAGVALGNSWEGIGLSEADRSFVQGNVIANNGRFGISAEAPTNRIHRNSIFSNRGGIRTYATAIPPPPILASASVLAVTGTACPSCVVEIFSDDGVEGRIFEGSVTADASGAFTLRKWVHGPWVTATATDASGSTSAFSPPIAGPPQPNRSRGAKRP